MVCSLIAPFFLFLQESTSLSGCLTAFIVKKLMSLLKKNEAITGAKQQLSGERPKEKHPPPSIIDKKKV